MEYEVRRAAEAAVLEAVEAGAAVEPAGLAGARELVRVVPVLAARGAVWANGHVDLEEALLAEGAVCESRVELEAVLAGTVAGLAGSGLIEVARRALQNALRLEEEGEPGLAGEAVVEVEAGTALATRVAVPALHSCEISNERDRTLGCAHEGVRARVPELEVVG